MLAIKQVLKQSQCQSQSIFKQILKKQKKQSNQSQLSQLISYNFTRKTKHTYQVNIKEDLINVKDVNYPFDQQELDTASPPRPDLYVSPLKKKEVEARLKKEFIIYQQQLKNQASQSLENTQETTQSKAETEFLWASTGIPPSRPYDNVENKELTYIYRDEKYFARSDSMISHLTHFQQPYTIHDQKIRDVIDFIKQKATSEVIQNSSPDFVVEQFYEKDAEIFEKLQELKTLISKAPYKLLPQIGLALSFELRYKIDVAEIWKVYVDILSQNMHHYTSIEMAQIKYALHGNFPKIGDSTIHRAFIDIVSAELHTCTISELLHHLQAFRNVKKDQIQGKIITEIVNRRKEIKNPDEFANVLYQYASCRVKTANRKKFRLQNEELVEAKQIFKYFINDLLTHIPNMSTEALIRLGTAVCILRLPATYGDILNRIERKFLQNKDSLDTTQLGQIFYIFSKMQNGQGFGSKVFYEQFLPTILKNFNQKNNAFTNNEKAKILYAYCQRKQLTPEQFNKTFLPWIKSEMVNFNYSDLHYVAYSLMFQQVTDKNIWKSFVHIIVAQPYQCPQSHYLPIKFARYYMDSLFPMWNFEPVEETCVAAEYSFNTLRIKNTHLNNDMQDLAHILEAKLQANIKLLVEFDNLLIVDFAVLPEKVAILYQETRFSQYDDDSISLPIYDLRAQILENNGWGVLRLNKSEFENKGYDKVQWLKENFEEVYKKQQEAYKSEELDRWGYQINKMEQMGSNATLESERHRDSGKQISF